MPESKPNFWSFVLPRNLKRQSRVQSCTKQSTLTKPSKCGWTTSRTTLTKAARPPALASLSSWSPSLRCRSRYSTTSSTSNSRSSSNSFLNTTKTRIKYYTCKWSRRTCPSRNGGARACRTRTEVPSQRTGRMPVKFAPKRLLNLLTSIITSEWNAFGPFFAATSEHYRNIY